MTTLPLKLLYLLLYYIYNIAIRSITNGRNNRSTFFYLIVATNTKYHR